MRAKLSGVAFYAQDAGILTQFPGNLIHGNVNRVDTRCAVLQQTVGESPSGRSNVETYFVGGVDVKISQSSFKFEPASTGIPLFAAIYFHRRIFGDGCT
jgi:hypothetical protein